MGVDWNSGRASARGESRKLRVVLRYDGLAENALRADAG